MGTLKRPVVHGPGEWKLLGKAKPNWHAWYTCKSQRVMFGMTLNDPKKIDTVLFNRSFYGRKSNFVKGLKNNEGNNGERIWCFHPTAKAKTANILSAEEEQKNAVYAVEEARRFLTAATGANVLDEAASKAKDAARTALLKKKLSYRAFLKLKDAIAANTAAFNKTLDTTLTPEEKKAQLKIAADLQDKLKSSVAQ